MLLIVWLIRGRGFRLVASMSGESVTLAVTSLARMRGLLGTRRTDFEGRVLVLAPCRAVHTLGMGYPIDIAFVAPSGEIIRVERSVAPGRILLRDRRARCVLERPAAPGGWLRSGEVVLLNTSPPSSEQIQG